MVHQPKVLIVDEPTVRARPAQRPPAQRTCAARRRRISRGMTVFFDLTHSLDIAQELADRIGIVDHGRLITCGTLAALRKQAALDGSLEDVFLKLTEELAQCLRGGRPMSLEFPLGDRRCRFAACCTTPNSAASRSPRGGYSRNYAGGCCATPGLCCSATTWRVRFITDAVLCRAHLDRAVRRVFITAQWYGFEELFDNGIERRRRPHRRDDLFDSLFFKCWAAMLVFSTGLILYASLFTGAEAKFLLTTAARADQIFAT